MGNLKTVIISAYSPKDTEIAALRIEKLAKFLSCYYETYVISGRPRREKKFFDTAKAKLIETRFKSYAAENLAVSSTVVQNTSAKKINKFNLYYFLEYFFPIAPGGMRFYKKRDFFSEFEKLMLSFDNNEKVLVIVSYGPHFILKIGRSLKKKYKDRIILVSDFRDPYRNFEPQNDSFKFMHKSLKKILAYSDLITTVSSIMKERLCVNYSVREEKVHVLYNGYDREDFNFSKIMPQEKSNIDIVFTGSFYPDDFRQIDPFLKALSENKNKNMVNFIYCGKDSDYVRNSFEKYGLSQRLTDMGMLDRKSSLELQNQSDCLLLVTYTGNDPDQRSWRISGKVYEYLQNHIPILNIGSPKWELRDILQSDGVSKVIPAYDTKGISDFIDMAVQKKLKPDFAAREKLLEEFSYERLIEKFVQKIESLKL
jgi:glycosyltransferase involved in cell wall biosynthesis